MDSIKAPKIKETTRDEIQSESKDRSSKHRHAPSTTVSVQPVKREEREKVLETVANIECENSDKTDERGTNGEIDPSLKVAL